MIKIGKFPFEDYAREYMESMRGIYQEETWKNRDRRYRRMAGRIKQLSADKVIRSSSPKSMTMEDVRQYILFAQESLAPSDMAHEVNALKLLFMYVGNHAVEECLQRYPGLRPTVKGRSRLPSMSDDSVSLILSRAMEIPLDDFMKVRAYALVVLVIVTGCRNKEIRLANVEDLDTDDWVLEIIHVKGEATYGNSRSVPIPPDARDVVRRYLYLRNAYEFESGVDSHALFPSKESKDGYLSGNTLRRMKDLVEEDLGIRFDLRQCRRTFGQMYLNKGLDLESVSVLMGHSTTRTTEKFYSRRRNDHAMDLARKTWDTEESE